MVKTLNAAGGLHTMEDFANASCDETTPISGTYKDAEVVEHPPNGQGATALLMLNILAQFDIASMDPFGTERAHIEAEATKLAYDARNRFLSDPGLIICWIWVWPRSWQHLSTPRKQWPPPHP